MHCAESRSILCLLEQIMHKYFEVYFSESPIFIWHVQCVDPREFNLKVT